VARRREAPRRELFGEARPRAPRHEIGTEKTEMANPFEFIQQVRETLITTGLVLLLVVFASLFFVTVDTVLREVVALVLGFRNSGG
jgi:preprotein translocase subunit SecE